MLMSKYRHILPVRIWCPCCIDFVVFMLLSIYVPSNHPEYPGISGRIQG